ncbi:hypothetical protein CEXT_764051 [Caerostris extrusa]|uniref:Uncharacterized protein n=1 Tax=Caerostris extrusa TaxID=172846 RepID=A0AAV4YBL6_CAEEX|nr:hypothetical protein CEXT_764051 [Caerostris extrusa]
MVYFENPEIQYQCSHKNNSSLSLFPFTNNRMKIQPIPTHQVISFLSCDHLRGKKSPYFPQCNASVHSVSDDVSNLREKIVLRRCTEAARIEEAKYELIIAEKE